MGDRVVALRRDCIHYGAMATVQIKNGRRRQRYARKTIDPRRMTLGRASMAWSTNQIRRLLIARELTTR